MPEWGGSVDRAAWVARDLSYGSLGIGDGIENMCRAVIEYPALFGCVELAGGALKQTRVEMFFELGNA